MSDTDSFIQEVTEEVRQDQMFALWKKWAPAVISGIVLVVAAAAGWSWYDAQDRAEAEARGTAFVETDLTVLEEVTALPGKIDGEAEVVAALTAAAALADAGQTVNAAARYAGIAARPGLAPEYADFAALQAVRLGAEGVELDPLTAPERPYRLLALELRAGRLLAAGDVEGAHRDLNTILTDPGATTALRTRAAGVLIASGGEVPGLDG